MYLHFEIIMHNAPIMKSYLRTAFFMLVKNTFPAPYNSLKIYLKFGLERQEKIVDVRSDKVWFC